MKSKSNSGRALWIGPVSFVLSGILTVVGYTLAAGEPPGAAGAPKLALFVLVGSGIISAILSAGTADAGKK